MKGAAAPVVSHSMKRVRSILQNFLPVISVLGGGRRPQPAASHSSPQPRAHPAAAAAKRASTARVLRTSGRELVSAG